MHMYQAAGACPLVKIIDILRDDEQIAWPPGIQFRQRVVRRVRMNVPQLRAALVIEAMNQHRIALERFWRADILDPMAFPQAIGPTKCRQSAFGRDSRTCQDHDIGDVVHTATMSSVPKQSYSLRMTRSGHSGIGQTDFGERATS